MNERNEETREMVEMAMVWCGVDVGWDACVCVLMKGFKF